MAFSNLIFLYLFLPLTLLVYFGVPNLAWKNAVLLLASLLFYAWGEPVYVFLMIGVAFINYLAGRLMNKQKKVALAVAVCFNLVLLGVFKYTGFLVANWNMATGMSVPVPNIVLPVGISFYTFQAMSYVVDVYRGRVEVQRSFARFLLYVSLFPQLIAGPIVRYADIQRQLMYRKTTVAGAFYGMTRFCIGLGKKVLLADYAGKAASALFSAQLTTLGAWLGAIFVMLQIYFDFSGYSDMAIGLGHILGFHYRENFNLPYTAKSITDFWRRWHISLGSFFRDYVYIPLGGNRRGRKRQIFNLLVVWLLTGLWHGASWNYVLWGLYYFVLLALEKCLESLLKHIPAVLRHCITLFLVLIGWVIFHFENLQELAAVLSAMFGGGVGFANTLVKMKLTNTLPLLAVCILGCTALPRRVADAWNTAVGGGIARVNGKWGAATVLEIINSIVIFAVCGLILYLSTVSLIGTGYSPFLYFRF